MGFGDGPVCGLQLMAVSVSSAHVFVVPLTLD